MTRTCQLGMFGAVALGLLLASGPAFAEGMVVCNVGGPGTTAQAAPSVKAFLRHMEASGGMAKNRLSGEYHTDRDECFDYIGKTKPLFGAMDLVSYLQKQEAWGLRPLAHMGKADGKRYYLLVRKGEVKDLAGLKGKKLISTVDDPVFISRLLLGGKVDAAAHFNKIKATARPLRAIKKVARGRYDAAIVDELAYKHLSSLKLPVELTALHSSPGLPGLTLVVFGNAEKGKAKVVKAALKALPRLCTGDGKKMCESTRITGFIKAKASIYKKLQKKYAGK